MGQDTPTYSRTDGARRTFTRALLRDVAALELMLERGMIESDVVRVGAEQEMALIDRDGRVLPRADRVLEHLEDPRFTHELGRFNLEFNLDPVRFESDCLSAMERELVSCLDRAREAAAKLRGDVVLTGIVPSITRADLTLDNMTDKPRYHALNRVLGEMRGGAAELNIEGREELSITHDSVMLEAANTSFQIHFQIDPARFALAYNIAQAAAGPVLAAACNSPTLLGRRLWHETRIALFQQSIETRRAARRASLRQFQPRVTFGADWVDDVLEIYREDIARFKPLFPSEPTEDPIAQVHAGRPPRLDALRLHNGTVYRWNRPCYGLSNGKPHLRIENRVLPAGPTPIDQVANAALWYGLMKGLADQYGDIRDVLRFDDVHHNFFSAARHGLDAQLRWIGGHTFPARELLALKLLPLAHKGLESAGIDRDDADRYLRVIEQRVAAGRSGSSWILNSLADLRSRDLPARALSRLALVIAKRQRDNRPVHEWPALSDDECMVDRRHVRTVGQYMTTDLFTVHESDVIDLVTNLMSWKHIRSIPVEDDEHRLVGLVSHRDLLLHLSRAGHNGHSGDAEIPVSQVMQRAPTTATPETTTLAAIELMRENKVGCLPVLEDGKLVGVVTEHDLMRIAAPVLQRFLHDDDEPQGPTPDPSTNGRANPPEQRRET